MKWIGGILVNAVLFLLLSWLIPSFIVSTFGAAILASFILAIVNMLVRPILVFFTLPATILTFGLFLFVVNALMLLLTETFMGNGFVIEGFGTALLIAFIMSVLNMILDKTILKPKKKRR